MTAGRKELADALERRPTAAGRGDGSRDLAEAGADRLDGQAEDRHEHRADENGHDRRGDRPGTSASPAEIASDPAATATRCGRRSGRLAAYALHFSKNCAGTAAIRRPRRSRIWRGEDDDRDSAREAVTTGYGMNLIAAPKRARPRIDEEDAGENRADREPIDPVAGDDAGDDDHERSRGAPDLRRGCLPATRSGRPATAAVTRPVSGGTPEAIAKAIASGMATMPTTTPAWRSARNWRRE